MKQITVLFLLLFLPSFLFANSREPEDGYAGNPPGRSTCLVCHDSFRLNQGQGWLSIINLPDTYQPGETYELEILLQDSVSTRWGFEITALTTQENERTGTFSLVDEQVTQISDRGAPEPQYVKQTQAGTYAGQRFFCRWFVNWTAPEENVGPISLYATGNTANNNNGADGDYIFAVSETIEAEEIPEPARYEMFLSDGWNLVASPIDPDDPLLVNLFEPLVQAGSLMLMVNQMGEIFDPLNGQNTIESWQYRQGYQIKVVADQTVSFAGTQVEPGIGIPIQNGWNWVAYTRLDTLHPAEAFEQLAQFEYYYVIDAQHRFLESNTEFCGLGMIHPGTAFKIYLEGVQQDSGEVTWPEPQGGLEPPAEVTPPAHFELDGAQTGQSMSILITQWAEGNGPIGVDEIGVRTSRGLTFGARMGGSEQLPIIIWGDDETTEEVDGFQAGDSLYFVYWNNHYQVEVLVDEAESLNGVEVHYQSDAFLQLGLDFEIPISVPERSVQTPRSFQLLGIYPNPFNSQTEVQFSTRQPGHVDISLLDLTGRRVVDLASQHYQSGQHAITLNAEGLTAGLYFVRLLQNDQVRLQRVVLMR